MLRSKPDSRALALPQRPVFVGQLVSTVARIGDLTRAREPQHRPVLAKAAMQKGGSQLEAIPRSLCCSYGSIRLQSFRSPCAH